MVLAPPSVILKGDKQVAPDRQILSLGLSGSSFWNIFYFILFSDLSVLVCEIMKLSRDGFWCIFGKKSGKFFTVVNKICGMISLGNFLEVHFVYFVAANYF